MSAAAWHQPSSAFAEVANDVFIEAPFHCSYGLNIRLGANVYLNAGCTILDSGTVRIGRVPCSVRAFISIAPNTTRIRS